MKKLTNPADLHRAHYQFESNYGTMQPLLQALRFLAIRPCAIRGVHRRIQSLVVVVDRLLRVSLPLNVLVLLLVSCKRHARNGSQDRLRLVFLFCQIQPKNE